MRLLINKLFGLYVGPDHYNREGGWLLHLMLIPRLDLTLEGELARCAWGCEAFYWPGSHRPWQVWCRSDAGWIIDTVAARAGA